MNEQIIFPDDWYFGFIAGEGVEFDPADVRFYDEQRSAAVRVFNEDQIYALGGGWSYVGRTPQWYEYSREGASACKRCTGRLGDRLYLFIQEAVEGVVMVTQDDESPEEMSEAILMI